MTVQALAARCLARTDDTRAVMGRLSALLASGSAAAALGAALAWRIGPHPFVLLTTWLAVITPTLVWMDLLEQRLPDALTVGSYPIVAGLVTLDAVVTGRLRPVVAAGTGLLLVGGFYLVVALLSPRGGLGAGDVKLAGLVGIITGSRRPDDAIVAILVGLLIGAILGCAVIVRRRSLRATLPLGPAILGGALLTLLLD